MNSYGACYKSKCDMDKELLTKFQSVVESFNRKEFTSHDFIKKFLERYENDYRENFSVKTLQATHAQLARLLSENAKALGITKSEKTLSENFHGKRSVVQGWKFLIVYLVAFVCTSMEMSAQTFLSIPNIEEDNVVTSQMYKVIRDKEYYPDDLKINAKISVIDTLKAKKMYEELRTGLNNGNEQLSRLTKLLSSKEKKIKDEADLSLVNDAFSWIKSSYPDLLKRNKINAIGVIFSLIHMNDGIIQSKDITSQIEKNIQSKKLTNHIKEILGVYQIYLTDSINKLNYKLSSEKWEQVVKPLPKKTIKTDIYNPYYRGFNYNDSELLDMVEEEQQQTWKWLYTSNYEIKKDTYPYELKYLSYNNFPQYKVRFNEYGYESYKIIPKFVYDSSGKLVYVASMTRNWDNYSNEVKRLVFLKDYKNNKYGIKSRSEKTQRFLKLMLCRDNGFEKTYEEKRKVDLKYRGNRALRNSSVYFDSDGDNYISQLRNDHESEFEYIYKIERVSNWSFIIVYLDSSLRPSHRAFITYITGNKPFTYSLIGRIMEIPKDLPPIVNCSGWVHQNVCRLHEEK